MRRTHTLVAMFATAALLAGTLAGPALAATPPRTTALDFVDITFKLGGTRTGALTIRLTRAAKTYANGEVTRAKPGSNKVRLFTDRIMPPGKYTLRWHFVPRGGGKASSGKHIVTVNLS
jgi:hypothetical protein